MIQPIREVSLSGPRAAYMLVHLRPDLRRALGHNPTWVRIADHLMPPSAVHHLLRTLATRASPPLVTLLHQADPSGDRGEAARWQPWPAHPPFADEITRRWPSDEFPPTEPVPVVEDQIPDSWPNVVLWPANGGLLDVWV